MSSPIVKNALFVTEYSYFSTVFRPIPARQTANGCFFYGKSDRADIEPEDLIRILALCGQKDDGYVARFSQFRDKAYPVPDRHHNVRKHEMYILVFDKSERLGAVISLKNCIRGVGELYFQSVDDVFFIVAYQNVIHDGSPFSFLGTIIS